MRVVLVVLPWLVACGEEGSEPSTSADAPTFWRDTAPLLEKHCVRCHDGEGIGPGDFRDPLTASSLAERMVQRIDAGEMPPPTSDPACRDFQDSERFVLDPAARDVIAAWADAGAPEGDPATATPTGFPVDHLDEADHVLSTAAPYTPEWDDGTEYRCFVLDWDEPADEYLTGFEFQVDNVAISHHAVLFVAPPGEAEAYVTDAATQSWRCGATPDSEWLNLHSWAPGSGPIRMAPDTGLKIAGGSKLVVQMHYYDAGLPAAPDRPAYAVTTTDSVSTELYYGPIGPYDFRIPAGDASYTDTESYALQDLVGFPVTFTIYGGSAHMHVLGKAYDVRYTHGDGTETCLMTGDYDFANQLTYWYRAPAVIDSSDGGVLDVSCTWDNSVGNPDRIHENPVDTYWGENTDEEMCFAFLYFSVGF